MKRTILKNIFTLLLPLFALTACGDDDPAPAPEAADKSVFTGTLDVSPREGSPFGAFSAEEIEFDIRTEADGSRTLVMPKIKFVEQMPVWISFEVRDLHPEATDEGFGFFIDRTLPYWNGAPYDPDGDGKYEISDLTGEYRIGEKSLHVSFICYSMQVEYLGQWVSSSAEVELP